VSRAEAPQVNLAESEERIFRVFRSTFLWVLIPAMVAGYGVPAAGESIFSSLGLGEQLLPTTARGAALGGAGFALADSVSISFLNPATASMLNRVTISVVFSPEVRYASGPEGAGKNWNSQLNAVKAVFPFPRSVALSVGLLLRGDMNSEAGWSGETSSAEYLGTYERSGGMFSLPAHLSIGFRNRFFLAGGVDLVQVSSREAWGKSFQSSEYQDSQDLLEGRFSGPRPSLSFLLDWSRRLTLGLVVHGAADLDGTLTTQPVFGKKFSTDASLHLPASYGAGISLQPKRGWMFIVEGSRMAWGDLRIADGAPLPDRASHGLAIGLERVSTRKTGTWFSRLPLRIGYRHESQPFDWPRGETVHSQMITMGTGFRLTEKAGRMDLALMVGRLGNESINGAEERVVRFLLSFTASERWQRKRQTHY